MSKISEFLDFVNGRIIKYGEGYYSIIWTNSGKEGAGKLKSQRKEIEDLIIYFLMKCKNNQKLYKCLAAGYFCIRDYPTHLFLVIHFQITECKLRIIKVANLYKSWPKPGDMVIERLLDGEIRNYIWKKR